MAFGYQTFYHGHFSYGPDHSISNHLNTEQVKVSYSVKFNTQINCYSDKLAIQIPTVLR